jgi:hypothetical protein
MFGAERAAQASTLRRLLYVLTSPLIPFVLLARLARNVLKNSAYPTKFLLSLPWILFYLLGWSLGELSGYLIGNPPAKRAQFEGSSSNS